MKRQIALALLCLPALSGADWKPADGPLTTPWTSLVSADRPLPEYPRPQMARKDWINLNGLWDFAIRPQQDSAVSRYDGRILVPFPVESALSGVRQPLSPDQRLWYRRNFTAPSLKGKRLLLHFGAVDWRAEVWVNGKAAGKHEGGYDPFTFDITDALKPKGPDEIVVAVWDPTDSGPQPRGKQVLNPNGIWYTAVSGIWQTVWLEPVPEHSISDLSMIPDLDGRKLRLTVHSGSPGEFTAIVRLAGKTAGRVSGKLNQELAVPLSDLKPWSPDSPTLYDLDVSLPSGDRVTSYFGMRKIEVREDAAGFNRLFLNGRPLFMIGPLDQGWWPDGLYTAPTDAALRSDIETLKKLGFNMCRKHVKVEPARYYYWCDKLGFLLWQDLPSAMPKGHGSVRRGSADDVQFTPAEDAIFRRELEALVRNLANVTSVVAWVPFNEGWGQHDTNDILKWVKALDGSRLVNGPSGWQDRGYGDMMDMHQYPGPAMFPAMPLRASVLGEFGGLGLPIEDHLWWNKRNWGYRTFEDRAKLQAGYDDLMQKLEPLVKQGLAAAVYTQTTDVEGEVNGLMTYDRKIVKFDAAKLADWHHRLIAEGQ
ncbi:MAG: glycoside hydrolase family 2 TIM barrel-domain containing protein [Candidatus Sulfopaludibacter sp.]|nr:glycoside hydrolase family 2 TIM barrel-domain containing protein [Candidatus Sulfopaludibacter sp.]